MESDFTKMLQNSADFFPIINILSNYQHSAILFIVEELFNMERYFWKAFIDPAVIR